MRNYITEFIGTFFLVMGAALAGPIGASLALMVMVYAGGHISGAHYNPAVTLAMLIRGNINMAGSIMYWIYQFFGGVLAAIVVTYVFEREGNGACGVPEDAILKGIAAEVLGTFALAFVVLNVATTKGTSGNSFYGLAIAGTVLAMAVIVGRYSGGAFNPAVAVSLSVQKSLCWPQIWIYLVSCFTGGALAALVFNYLNKDDTPVPPVEKEVA